MRILTEIVASIIAAAGTWLSFLQDIPTSVQPSTLPDWLVDGGAFGAMATICFYAFHTLKTSQDRQNDMLKEAIERNTAALDKLQGIIAEDRVQRAKEHN